MFVCSLLGGVVYVSLYDVIGDVLGFQRKSMMSLLWRKTFESVVVCEKDGSFVPRCPVKII